VAVRPTFPEPAIKEVSCLLGLAGVLFSLLAASVSHVGVADTLDRHVEVAFLALAHPALTPLMFALSWLGSGGCVYGVLLAGVILVYRYERAWLLTLLISTTAHDRLTIFFKALVHRERPHPLHPILVLTDYSFPSGHVLAATLFYGWLGIYAAYHIRSTRWRAAALAACGGVIALVAVSRMYLEVHYLSDVMAGALLGTAWIAMSITLVSQCRPKMSGWAADRRRFAGIHGRVSTNPAQSGDTSLACSSNSTNNAALPGSPDMDGVSA
jgi:membrane-associated phospholipid phosphatase